MANWNKRSRRHYASRDAYLAALVRQLRRVAPNLSVQREVWLGRTREMGVADLVLGGELLVHVQKGFGQTAAEWSLAQARSYQLTRPQMPKLIVVFDAERGQLFEGAVRLSLEQLHQYANTVAVRV